MTWRGPLLVLLAATVAHAGASGPVKGLDDEGFVNLFDGKTLEGWSAVATDRFLVRDGVIANDGGTGWLRSEKSYKDFEFRVEYRALKAGADSGVFFRATAESDPKPPNWPLKCYQLQVVDAPGHLMLFGHGAPATFDRNADSLKSAMKDPGEWQALTLRVVGQKAEVTLNGAVVTVSDAIALTEGRIGLQGEHGQFEWRAPRIKELPSP